MPPLLLYGAALPLRAHRLALLDEPVFFLNFLLSFFWFDSEFCFSPKPLAFGQNLSSHVCASLDWVQVAGLLDFSSAAFVRRI